MDNPGRFESKLWAMADKLRSNRDAADYKHIVLGLIFLKFISDKFEAKRAELLETPNADPEERDDIAQNVCGVPKGALVRHSGQGQASLTSLKEKLIKIGAKVVSHGRYVVFQMAEVAIPRQMFQEILRLIAELRPQLPPALV
jgi:hypothetical protein